MEEETILMSAEIFKQEHELIEQELIELETIMKSEVINYPNLVHTLKKLKAMWDSHESREQRYFDELDKKGFKIPGRIFFGRGKLKQDWDGLIRAMQSGSEFRTKSALMTYGVSLMSEIRRHMADEDWVLYALPDSMQEIALS